MTIRLESVRRGYLGHYTNGIQWYTMVYHQPVESQITIFRVADERYLTSEPL